MVRSSDDFSHLVESSLALMAVRSVWVADLVQERVDVLKEGAKVLTLILLAFLQAPGSKGVPLTCNDGQIVTDLRDCHEYQPPRTYGMSGGVWEPYAWPKTKRRHRHHRRVKPCHA
jgi:hypothetical protein